jgi:hypothetical protein
MLVNNFSTLFLLISFYRGTYLASITTEIRTVTILKNVLHMEFLLLLKIYTQTNVHKSVLVILSEIGFQFKTKLVFRSPAMLLFCS